MILEAYKENRRRLRMISIQIDYLMDFILFLAGSRAKDAFLLPYFGTPGLPKDTTYIESYYCQEYRAQRIIIWSSEFDPVPEGDAIPYIANPMTFERVGRVRETSVKKPSFWKQIWEAFLFWKSV